MNTELIKSVALKVLPVVVAFAIGKGWLTQETADRIPEFIEWLLAGAVLIPTILRSFKNHGKPHDPIDLKPA